MRNFINRLSKDTRCENMFIGSRDVSLVNKFYNENFFTNFPDIWFDWMNRMDSELMIIGQDWGPFSAMEKVRDSYKLKTNDRKHFIDNTKDKTTKRLKAYLVNSSEGKISENYIDNIFFTVSVFFARQGTHFRGNHNFAPTESARRCLPLLEEQINIVKPKVIMTLGSLALTSVAALAKYELKDNLTKSIESMSGGHFKYKNIVVIPNFHPAAHVTEDQYMKQYRRLWNFISINTI